MKLNSLIFILMLGLFCASAKPCTLVNSYKIKFDTHSCIKPYHKYEYVTCHIIPVMINKTRLYIPENFQTDLASIPRWLWPIVAPAHSQLMSASILHDYLYTDPEGFNRKEVDSIFYNALVGSGVDKAHAYLMYSAVRLFGGSHFNYADKIAAHLHKKLIAHAKS